tara:strand:- start:487 stop:864 length:378 start_codon:yes stop_codon:yes gene_type:complete
MSEEFVNPLDSMPIATYIENDGSTGPLIPPPNKNMYAPPEKMKDLDLNPRPEEEIADWFDESDQIEYGKSYASRHESTPEHEKSAEEIVTMHEKAYRLARAKYNPFAIGGSESIHDFQGGSENVS